MNEIWKDIKGYEGMYQVSSEGRVKSLKFGKEKIMKNNKSEDGYLYANLYKDRKMKNFKVHRLVAQAFIDNPDNLLEINHIDEDKANNRVDNLEWCSRDYNINFGTRNEKVFYKLSKPVLQFTKEGEFVCKWGGTRQIERELGYYHTNISECCKGKYKTAYGYIWKYAIKFNIFDLAIEK